LLPNPESRSHDARILDPERPCSRGAAGRLRQEAGTGAAGARTDSGPSGSAAPPPPPANDDAERRARDAAEKAKALRGELADLIHFDFDKADIRTSDQGILDRKAAILAANSAVRLRVAGHCDERGSDEYNLALGNRRGAAAKRYLTGKGVDDGRIEVVSYGKERPSTRP